ncbi:MAG: minichromosome maintenance protein MCM [Candidatus Methanomethylophilaceae archaeon]|nr:minichromosome maintenance protein MCM [Candidatus Methanomethylophilaceae archaeon]MBR4216692.1 minichromosome maintenance protein MCM [Candidatus Methanomethylophilaceae archaeon]
MEILRKYVAYSKRMVPIMTDEAYQIIEKSYLSIRASAQGNSVPITARQLEAFVRLSEASAKMRLSDKVTELDANRAVDLVEFYLKKIAGSSDGGFDIDKVMSGISSKSRDKIKVLKRILEEFGEPGITLEEIIVHCSTEGISEDEAKSTLNTLCNNAEVIKTPKGEYMLV